MATAIQRPTIKAVANARGNQLSLTEVDVNGKRINFQCKKCGEIVHVDPSAPATKCPVCGGELYTRADDTAERAKHRLDVYHHETLPVKNFYQNSGKYVEINGNQTPEQVFEELVNVLKKVK